MGCPFGGELRRDRGPVSPEPARRAEQQRRLRERGERVSERERGDGAGARREQAQREEGGECEVERARGPRDPLGLLGGAGGALEQGAAEGELAGGDPEPGQRDDARAAAGDHAEGGEGEAGQQHLPEGEARVGREAHAGRRLGRRGGGAGGAAVAFARRGPERRRAPGPGGAPRSFVPSVGGRRQRDEGRRAGEPEADRVGAHAPRHDARRPARQPAGARPRTACYPLAAMLDAPLLALLRRPEGDLRGLVRIGSRVYGTARPDSDEDFFAVLRDPDAGHDLLFAPGRNVVVHGARAFEASLRDQSVFALECLFAPAEHRLVEFSPPFRYRPDPRALAAAAAAKAKADYDKALRRYDDEPGPSKKKLFHALRVLAFAAQAARHGRLIDFREAEPLWRRVEAFEGDAGALRGAFADVYEALGERLRQAAAAARR